MTEQILFRIWSIGIYLLFGAWDLVLAVISMLHVLCLLKSLLQFLQFLADLF